MHLLPSNSCKKCQDFLVAEQDASRERADDFCDAYFCFVRLREVRSRASTLRATLVQAVQIERSFLLEPINVTLSQSLLGIGRNQCVSPEMSARKGVVA